MKILIVGLGAIARKHIKAIRELDPDAEIHALRSHRDAIPYAGVHDIYDPRDMDGDYDFAIISNPTSSHASTIARLKDLGIPLFIEKPVFGELGHETLLEEIRERDITTYVACNLRFLGCVRYLHDYIRTHPQRRVNEVNVYCGSWLPGWRPGTDYRQCYSAIPELGGGVHIDLIHDIDYTCWIFGKPDETVRIFRSVSSLGIRAVDYASYTFLYPGFTATVVLNYYRRDYRRTMEVVFEDGTWLADIAQNRITDEGGNVVYEGEDTIADTYLPQMGYFMDLVRRGVKAENGIGEAYDILKICLGNERS